MKAKNSTCSAYTHDLIIIIPLYVTILVYFNLLNIVAVAPTQTLPTAPNSQPNTETKGLVK